MRKGGKKSIQGNSPTPSKGLGLSPTLRSTSGFTAVAPSISLPSGFHIHLFCVCVYISASYLNPYCEEAELIKVFSCWVVRQAQEVKKGISKYVNVWRARPDECHLGEHPPPLPHIHSAAAKVVFLRCKPIKSLPHLVSSLAESPQDEV